LFEECLLRPNQFFGKTVIDTEAKIVGEICDLEFDPSNWTITHVCISLSDDAIQMLEYNKPFLGKVQVIVPTEIVMKVSDLVSINRSIPQLKTIIEQRK
jgi:sporulation protein YlmC with PRC-barrel domain